MKQVSLLFIFLITVLGYSQQKTTDSLKIDNNVTFTYKALILPTGLIGYGILGIKNNPIKKWDRDLRNRLKPDGTKLDLDDYTLLLPIATVYGLDLAGIKGRNNMRDKTIILGTSTLFLCSVNIIKNNTNIRRPSGRSQSSFPSGHTAVVFMAAEFLHQEYGDVSLWYSMAGYGIATATGFLRIYNDKHWLSDVAAGAGIGILSTKIGYWLFPYLKNVIFKNQNKSLESQVRVSIAPLYTGNELLLAASIRF